MLGTQQDFERLINNMAPFIDRIINRRMREVLCAKIATVESVTPGRCNLSVDGVTLKGIKVASGVSLAVGNTVLLEYIGSLSNAFVRTKL